MRNVLAILVLFVLTGCGSVTEPEPCTPGTVVDSVQITQITEYTDGTVTTEQVWIPQICAGLPEEN